MILFQQEQETSVAAEGGRVSVGYDNLQVFVPFLYSWFSITTK